MPVCVGMPACGCTWCKASGFAGPQTGCHPEAAAPGAVQPRSPCTRHSQWRTGCTTLTGRKRALHWPHDAECIAWCIIEIGISLIVIRIAPLTCAAAALRPAPLMAVVPLILLLLLLAQAPVVSEAWLAPAQHSSGSCSASAKIPHSTALQALPDYISRPDFNPSPCFASAAR